ncbi:hypothetical protein [Butyrivibrio fibrisolvens]|uniref:hypothetical protein n=1 Tax=Butyrivibrio fibrisolvens TaxID=831 RepID=UPI0003B362E0|nr:hypothetical protein [Butyrivibrio fibrisolvens]
MLLYHYFDKKTGSFRNLSDLSEEEARKVLLSIKSEKPETMCAKRQDSYIADRRRFEEILRNEFLKKGGIIERKAPHYLVVGECPWLQSWFEDCDHIVIDTDVLDLRTVSFTYGDSHPTFSDRVNDGKEYRKKIYTYDEIIGVIGRYGLPQDWNPDGEYGPERYVEAHVWSDRGIFSSGCTS